MRGKDASHVSERNDAIESPVIDKRKYRWLKLENAMQVLLISDTTADKAAASMDVSVGHAFDPAELPGLAHFLEHMLFLGTEKYPDEDAYQQYLSRHGGSSNAYTAFESTTRACSEIGCCGGHLRPLLCLGGAEVLKLPAPGNPGEPFRRNEHRPPRVCLLSQLLEWSQCSPRYELLF